MTYEERRKEDNHKEKIVHEFIEKVFYSKFPTYKTNNDRETQIRGVDCTLTSKDGTEWIIDEKAATRDDYINAGMHYPGEKNPRRYLGTFCLELSMRYRRGNNWKRCTGWFLNHDEINNAYLFVWIDKTKSGHIQSVDDILEAEICFVSKKKIWEYMNSLGWTQEKLENELENILLNPERYDKKIISGLKFSHPQWLRDKESPINILISREIYRKFSEFNMIYHDNNILKVAE